jgi:SAM-dependent methyltransferase
MDPMNYFYEIFCSMPRSGPGDALSTRKAFGYLKNLPAKPQILDIGCGQGMQTIELAKLTKGLITALDSYQPFLDILMKNAHKEGVEKQILPKNQSMLEMDFENNSFDVIWSEGALYIMGFQKGLKKCRQLLKSQGYLAVTEAVLFTTPIPPPLQEFWDKMYPVIMDVPQNIALIQNEGFRVVGHFPLPQSSWTDSYYIPMQNSLNHLKKKYHDTAAAQQVFDEFDTEIQMYKQYSEYYGYEFFIMQKK